MARQPSGKDKLDKVEPKDVVEIDEIDDDADGDDRSAATVALWGDVDIEPVEISFTRGSGFTLRAYRPKSALAAPEIEPEEDDFAILRRAGDRPEVDDDLDADALEDDELLDDDELDDERRARRARASDDDSDDDSGDRSRGRDGDEPDADADEDDEADEADDEDDDAEADGDEEVPVFLGKGGKVYLFRSAEGLVEFVKSDAEHEMLQLESWDELRRRITVDDVVPTEDNQYELDLVVENLRGGHDAWDTDLLLEAGEVARDLAYALRMEAVLTALSPGSPLDDLDEALRATAAGGVGGFFARRRLRKIGAQQAALGWRTIIGKITGAVDWRD